MERDKFMDDKRFFSRGRVQLFYDGSSDGCCSVSAVTAVISADCRRHPVFRFTSWLLAMVPLYLVAIPVCAKMMQALPNMQLYRNEMRPGQWIRTLCICIFVMYVGKYHWKCSECTYCAGDRLDLSFELEELLSPGKPVVYLTFFLLFWHR